MKRSRVFGLLGALAVSLWSAGFLWGAQDYLWNQTFNFHGFDTTGVTYDTIVIGAVAASTSTLIVCGTSFDSSIDTKDIGFIKAFDQATGNPKWDKTLTDATGGGNNRNSFGSLAVVGNTVLVEAYSSSYTTVNNAYVYTLNQTSLWAFDAVTGALLWGPINKDAAAITNGPVTMVTANNKVFVVRQQNPHRVTPYGSPTNTGDFIIQAYQIGATTAPMTSLLLQ